MDFLKGFEGFAHWLPRLSLAATFAYHALPKLTESGAMAEMMGMPAIVVMMLGAAEMAGAALMLFGGMGSDSATRIAGLIFCIVMVGAIGMVARCQRLQLDRQHGVRVPTAHLRDVVLLRGKGERR